MKFISTLLLLSFLFASAIANKPEEQEIFKKFIAIAKNETQQIRPLISALKGAKSFKMRGILNKIYKNLNDYVEKTPSNVKVNIEMLLELAKYFDIMINIVTKSIGLSIDEIGSFLFYRFVQETFHELVFQFSSVLDDDVIIEASRLLDSKFEQTHSELTKEAGELLIEPLKKFSEVYTQFNNLLDQLPFQNTEPVVSKWEEIVTFLCKKIAKKFRAVNDKAASAVEAIGISLLKFITAVAPIARAYGVSMDRLLLSIAANSLESSRQHLGFIAGGFPIF